MQENSRYAVGIDIGTTEVRAVVAHIDSTTGTPTVVGVGKAASGGMRKGTIVTLGGPAQAIDEALGEAERMSGHQVNEATMTINGTHISYNLATTCTSSCIHETRNSDASQDAQDGDNNY